MPAEFLPPLTAIAPIVEPGFAAAPAASSFAADATQTSGSNVSFASLVSSGLDEVSRQLQASQLDLQRLAAGDATNLHQIMIRMEETRLSFQLMLQVRNRLLESYQDVMRMQV